MDELTDQVHGEIKRLCASGDEYAQNGRYAEALKDYWAAWEHLPEPKTKWNAGLWILAAVGDANFLEGDFEAGRDNLSQAMHCPGAFGNAFVHLRLGQCQFELREFDRAADELLRAYLAGGPRVFVDQPAKYLEFLRTRAKDIDAPKAKSKWKFWQ